MIEKNRCSELITANEAAEICKRAGTLSSVDRAIKIYAAMLNSPVSVVSSRFSVEQLWALAAVYDAGRIQGIREQREHCRNKAAAQSAAT